MVGKYRLLTIGIGNRLFLDIGSSSHATSYATVGHGAFKANTWCIQSGLGESKRNLTTASIIFYKTICDVSVL